MIYSLAFQKNNGIVTIKPVEKLDFLAVEQPRSQVTAQRERKRRDLGIEVGRVRKSIPPHNAPNKPQNEFNRCEDLFRSFSKYSQKLIA